MQEKKPLKSLKIALVGAGSASFGRATIGDILLSPRLSELAVELWLMDIVEAHLHANTQFALDAVKAQAQNVTIHATTNLNDAVKNAAFVVTAIEVERYKYWAQDFHIPRKYGFTQIYGENGGPGGMFHTLRNLGPMLDIARAMESLCPDAWLINYTNPEAKLVEAVSKLTRIKAVGLCHGVYMGRDQLARFLGITKEKIVTTSCGLNHFGWFQKITHKETGEDLYPLLREKERQAHWLASWDEIALCRILFNTFGLWPYPGTNHCGEYLRWSTEFFAGDRLQFFHNPLDGKAWEQQPLPTFVYSMGAHPTDVPMNPANPIETLFPGFEQPEAKSPQDLKPSGEDAVGLMEAILFDLEKEFPALNVPNKGSVPGLGDETVVEVPARVNAQGIHPIKMQALPEAVTMMIRLQGSIHQLIIEAFQERSRNKLLQAVLLDPTLSSYANAIAMINEMCEVQKELLPPLQWMRTDK